MDEELKKALEETKGLVADFQTKYDEKVKDLGEKVAANEPEFEKMETKFAELSEKVQTLNDEKKASDEQVKELELKLARNVGSSESKEIEMTPEIKEALDQSLRLKSGSFAIPRETVKANFEQHVEKYYAHLPAEKQELMVKNLLAEGSESAGGMWCPVPMDSRIRQRQFETSPMRQVAEVLNINTQAIDFALDDEEAEAAKSGEINTRSETDVPEFGKVKIEVHEVYAKPKATLALLEDNTINLESWLSGKVSRKFARTQNKAFIVGTGDQEAKGVLDYDDANVEVYERKKLGTVETAASLAISGDDLIDLQSHLLEDYQANASWMMHRLVWAKVLKLKDDDGQYLLNPAILFSGAAPQLLGADVRMAGDMPKPNAGALVAGQLSVLYGDFREGYTIVDRLGINVIRDNITQSGFVKWYFRARYGGGVTNFQAIKRLKIKA